MTWDDKEASCEYAEIHWFQLVSGKQGKVLRRARQKGWALRREQAQYWDAIEDQIYC